MPNFLLNSTSHRTDFCLISVVLPVFNESQVLGELLQRISAVLRSTDHPFEVIFVNDGSTDESPELLDLMASLNSHVRVVHLARNFGQQAAVHAGVQHASGQAVIVMDSDMQDDPNAIAEFVKKWKAGFDVVYAVREKRKESRFKRVLYFSFYRLLGSMSKISIPMDAGNFCLIDRAVATEIVNLAETDRYFPGLRSWVGFRQTAVVVERLKRYDQKPRISWKGLVSLAKTALISFSSLPLSIFYGIAFSLLSLSLLTAAIGVILPAFSISSGELWSPIIAVSAFFGALNSLGIAVIGEYVSRIYDQVRQRPAYVVARTLNMNLETGGLDDAELDLLMSQDWPSPEEYSVSKTNSTMRSELNLYML